MDKDEQPFGLIDECIFNMDGECEILTILGVEEHGFEEFGDLLDEDEEVDGPVRLPDSQPQDNQRFQLNNVKMFLRVRFQARKFRYVYLQAFLNQILLVEKNLRLNLWNWMMV